MQCCYDGPGPSPASAVSRVGTCRCILPSILCPSPARPRSPGPNRASSPPGAVWTTQSPSFHRCPLASRRASALFRFFCQCYYYHHTHTFRFVVIIFFLFPLSRSFISASSQPSFKPSGHVVFLVCERGFFFRGDPPNLHGCMPRVRLGSLGLSVSLHNSIVSSASLSLFRHTSRSAAGRA